MSRGTVGWIVCALILGVVAWDWYPRLTGPVAPTIVGIDHRIYTEAAQSWLHGGPFYHPYQLAGPYDIAPPAVLYPPPMLLLFVPLSFLPALMWWLLPLSVLAWALWKLRPSPWAWAMMALLLLWPGILQRTLTGNPGIFFVAALALGCVYKGPAALVLLKPTLAPFALVGIRSERWWLFAFGLIAVGLLFAPMASDYLQVIQNARTPGGLFYSIDEIPAMMIPITAWVGRLRHLTEEGDLEQR